MKIIEGKSGVWHMGPGGTLLLPKRFYEDGQLTAEGACELERADIAQRGPTDRYNLTVVTSTACNLGCPYCFQNTDAAAPGRFDPPRIDKQVLDGPTIDRIVDFTRPRMEQAGATRLFVLLFGGEPLLNPWACRELLVRLRALGPVTASMVTNGVLLTARKAKRLESAGLRSVQITLDGPRELHDGLRATRSGRGTFEAILDNLAAVQEATALRFTLRLNTTSEGLPLLEDLIRDLSGRLDPTRCSLDVAPVLNYAGMFDNVLDRSGGEVETILRAYAAALESGFEVGWPGGGECGFCGEQDGVSGAVINADGTLYSCWETIGKPDYEVGTIDDGYSDYPQERWVSCGEFSKKTATEAASKAFDDALSVGLLEMLRQRRRALESAS